MNKFTVNEYVCANCDYPGDWNGEIKRIVKDGNTLVTVVRVFPKDRSTSFHVVSFAQIVDDKIIALDEYWTDDGPPPGWRQEMNIGQPILKNKSAQ